MCSGYKLTAFCKKKCVKNFSADHLQKLRDEHQKVYLLGLKRQRRVVVTNVRKILPEL